MNPLLVKPDEDVFGGLLAGMTPKEAGGLAKSGVEYAGSLLDNIASGASRVAEKAPGSLGRAWQSSDFRRKAQEALDTASYYAGPHLSNRAEAVAKVIPAITPKFGTEDAAAAGEAFKEGKVGRGAGLMGLGVAGGLLDALPGEAAVKGLLKGLTKAAHYTPDLSMAIAPIKAFHGSPFDFEKFDLKKIGTGEGAQAYGHGLYFAGNEDVARQYRDALSGARLTDISQAEKYWLPKAGGDREKAIQMMLDYNDTPTTRQLAEQMRKPPGRMYEVGIHADPEKLLDWDRPLSAQSQAAKKAYADARGWSASDLAKFEEYDPGRKGASLYTDLGLASGKRDMQSAASQALHEAGIPGIKYFDQGSRGAGEGSRNYVTFSDDIVEILRKYGLAGAGVGLGGAMAMQPGLFPLPQQQ